MTGTFLFLKLPVMNAKLRTAGTIPTGFRGFLQIGLVTDTWDCEFAGNGHCCPLPL